MYLYLTFFLINLFLFKNLEFFSNLINLYDYPDNLRKIHTKKTSLIGGVIFFINILLLFIYNLVQEYNLSYIVFALIFTLSFILNLINDKKNIKPIIRLTLMYLLFLIWILLDKNMVIKSLNFELNNTQIDFSFWNLFLTPFFILLFFNALNLFDGVNLQSITYFLLFILFFHLNNISISNFLPLVIFIIFYLIYNFRNKMYLGDSGISVIAIFLSYLTIYNYNNSNKLFCDEIFLIMFLPGVDMFRVYCLRLLKKKNPFYPDQNHFHHYFLNLINKKYIFLVQFILTLISLLMKYYFFIGNIKIIVFLIITYILLISYASNSNKKKFL